MSANRIQKLLFSEYCEFEDMVLIESPFAETTRDGTGIRQVHLGLTPTKLVIATDVISSAKESNAWCLRNIDPDIESFELISMYPVDCVNLSIFRKKKRQALKAHFCNNRVLYFELGGFEKKNMFWNLWCERVKFLNPNELFSSRSETSVGSTSSSSTLYLISANAAFPVRKKPQLWCTFKNENEENMRGKWMEKDLFLGNRLEQLSPSMFSPGITDSISDIKSAAAYKKRKVREKREGQAIKSISNSSFENLKINTDVLRHKSGFELSIKGKLEYKELGRSISELTSVTSSNNSLFISDWNSNFFQIVETAVSSWENAASKTVNKFGQLRHHRRYAFAAQPHFYFGFGPWDISNGEKYSVQVKRVVSLVRIRRQPIDPDLRLSISRRQLISSLSYDTLLNRPRYANSIIINSCLDKLTFKPVVVFWTPELWYRPRSARSAYKELHNHLRKINKFHQNISRKKGNEKSVLETEEPTSSLQYLRHVLCLNIHLSAWDFDSTTLAYQLTTIDRDLFLKITEPELSILFWQRSSKNAPNIGAIIAFSHRIRCLFTTEILREDNVKFRARLISRFITTAEKCHKILNFQSCKSVLCSLQSPPIYRLHSTWDYVRQKHPSKYQLFEKLCRIYKDPRTPIYQKTFHHARKCSPYLPYIGDILDQLTDKIPNMWKMCLDNKPTEPQINDQPTILQVIKSSSVSEQNTIPQVVRRFLSAFRIWPSSANVETRNVHWQHNNKSEEANKVYLAFMEEVDKYDYKIIKQEDVDNKIIRLREMGKLLKMHQKAAANYALCTSDLANEYLLKARYKEDKDNFYYSFNVENKTVYGELHNKH